MANNKHLQQWIRTTRFLQEARAKIPQAAVLACLSDLEMADEFIQHNELGLAADWLSSIAKEFECNSVQAMQSLALAEASMGRVEKQSQLDLAISQLLGRPYETTLLPDA